MPKRDLVLSVHQLVDFLLRKGNIDNRVYNRSAMSEGTRIHNEYQSLQDSSYISEYPLQITITREDLTITIQGRADGIIKSRDRYIIDEIKSTVEDLKDFREEQLDWHLGQAKCYAYMFAKMQNQDSVGVRLTYIKQGNTQEKLIDDYVFMFDHLEKYVLDLIDQYLDFYQIILKRLDDRKISATNLEFPFDNFRDGQRQLSKYVYSVSQKGGMLFVEAPTGIGKTMSTLFPYIKSLADDENSKIFYLTAKSSGKESAMNAIRILKNSGLSIDEILITAKEKICFCKGKSCNPDECPFTEHYYDKVVNVIRYALLSYSTFDYKTITHLAYENRLCPFELQLDLSLYCDIIVCDYNYMYDPTAYLHRYFDDDASHYLALVDEAHNLVDRSREMYSATLSFNTYKEMKKSIRGSEEKGFKNITRKLNKLFNEASSLEEGNTVFNEFSSDIYKTLRTTMDNLQEISKKNHKVITKEVTALSMEINSFLKMFDLFSERYIAYISNDKNDTCFHLFCKDASRFLMDINKSLKAVTCFSATMSPIEYYINTLGGEILTDPYLILPSPFDKNNLLLMIAPKVSIKYKNREASYPVVAEYIKAFTSKKTGNYFVYVPSYEYLAKLKENLKESRRINYYYQEKEMSEQDKEIFLSNFVASPKKTSIGFLVIGGAFSEGIDLVSDRLIGAVIVGVGAPRINFESDQIAEYYKAKEMDGYNYAYLYPGMNKVMQAVGRVIRSESDRGAVLLIDERYTYRNYRSLFKSEWDDYKVVYRPEDVDNLVSKFFNK